MGKFDKSRLKFKHNESESNSGITDLRLKLAKKNQILDARQVLNKKKQQVLTTNKKKIINEESFKSGSLMIMKTLDEDTGAEKRLYKVR
jgi:hypothetical protein